MVLYTCGQKLGTPSVHPCGIAGNALVIKFLWNLCSQ
jgi:hypothetical protein